MLVSIVILVVWSLVNFMRIDQVGWLVNFAAFVQVGTTLVVLCTVLAMAPQLNSSEYVFFDYNNDTGFSSVGYVVCISLLLPLYTFAGYDASGHVAEETQGSRLNAPLGIIYAVTAGGVSGLILILALLYGMQSLTGAINSASGNAAVQIFLQATNSPCAIGLTWLVMVNIFFTGVSSVSVTARITFALVRDEAVPFHKELAWIEPTYKQPVNSILLIFAFDALLLLLPLTSAGSTAFLSLTGINTIGLQVSTPSEVSELFPVLLSLIASPTALSKSMLLPVNTALLTVQ